MSVEELESAVAELSPDEFRRLAARVDAIRAGVEKQPQQNEHAARLAKIRSARGIARGLDTSIEREEDRV